ncbi:hypothetical protein HanRHA438_Chr16g0763081 [Helianthus annuus]|nr:hypothetical protein HanIR_Chr16g0816331 [Helianthus annuus]KAJ0836106.1 hypothetical protein HanRHA438_Chr16g0763081 [Helianthus annuus]
MASTTHIVFSLFVTLVFSSNLQTIAARRLSSVPGPPSLPPFPGTGNGLPTLPLPPFTPSNGLPTLPLSPFTPSNGLPTLPLSPFTPSNGLPTLPLPPFTPSTGLPTLPLPPFNPSLPNFPFPIGTPSIVPPLAGIFTPPVAGTVHP